MKFLIIILLSMSCSHTHEAMKDSKASFGYTDVSGTYGLNRESKTVKQRIVTRNLISSTVGSASKVVEKSITVSKLGSIKSGRNRVLTMRPEASEFSVWLEGKKYQSRMLIDTKKKSMRITLDSPEAKWKGISDVPFPKGKYFCFYNQIPECLYHNLLLEKALSRKEKSLDFYIVWDTYPYLQDQLTNIGHKLFAAATVKFDGEIKNNFRYIVEVDEQAILYYFSKSWTFVKMAWIAQGITIVPPGEVSLNEDE